ncbi:MAG: SigE family RNA polymerase sigma factor [Nocardioidaceae bacterium]|nr:SigE family RNA polymerase sigma factor [Nocardioidaceae bacterium]
MSTEHDFVEFVAARWTSLYRLAYLLTGSPSAAEDLLQTTFEKAYASWPRISRMDFPEAYLRRMLTNALASSRRRAWLREVSSDAVPEGASDATDVGVLDRSLLWPLVCALPVRQRAVIVLRYYEDLTEAQIADVLGCAPGTVKSQTSAAMKTLRRALAAAGVGEVLGES